MLTISVPAAIFVLIGVYALYRYGVYLDNKHKAA
jgi:hypothetical protein